MLRRSLLLALVLSWPSLAQTKLSVEQLVAFVKSSIQMKHPDRQVAEFLKKVTLTNRLDIGTVEDLQGEGAGPRTTEVLMILAEASKGLSAPPPAPRKVVVAIPRPSSEEQGRVLDQVREYALNYVRQLPNFICLQTIRRYYDPAGIESWHMEDTIATRLTYYEQKENYKVVAINGHSTDVAYDRLPGATSSGEFGTMMREIFEPSTETRFEWERWGTLRARRVHVYSYRVSQSRSQWHVNYQRTQDIVPAYSGLIYVDNEFPAVLRISMEAEDIPVSFPIQRAGIVLDFDYQKIGNQDHLLPMSYVMNMREGRFLVKNEVQFSSYRKYSAEAIITFDETPAPPLADDKAKEPPVKAPSAQPPPPDRKK